MYDEAKRTSKAQPSSSSLLGRLNILAKMLTFLRQSLTNGKYSTFHALCGSDKLNNITYACAHKHTWTHTLTYTWSGHTDTRGHIHTHGHTAISRMKLSFAPLIPEAHNCKNCQIFECMDGYPT